MNIQTAKTVVVVSLIALLMYFPGLLVIGSITPAFAMGLGMSTKHVMSIALVVWFIYRLILFLWTGLAVGSKVASLRISHAIAAGVLVTIGLVVLEATATGTLAGGHPSRLPLGKTVGYVGVLAVQIACSAIGGWMASRRTLR